MASRSGHASTHSVATSSFFEQRNALVGDIAVSLEHVLQNINKLNRSLEGVIAVGNEFGAVEALWSQFEGVMAQEPETSGQRDDAENNDDQHASEEEHDEKEVETTDNKRRGRSTQ